MSKVGSADAYQELAVLQDWQQTALTMLRQATRELSQMFVPIAAFLAGQGEADTVSGRWVLNLPDDPVGHWWSAIFPQTAAAHAGIPSADDVLAVVDRIAAQDDVSQRAQQDRQPHVVERRT